MRATRLPRDVIAQILYLIAYRRGKCCLRIVQHQPAPFKNQRLPRLSQHILVACRGEFVTMQTLAPRIIETDMSSFTKTEAGRTLAPSMRSLKRIGKPDDVADVITFLASDGAR